MTIKFRFRIKHILNEAAPFPTNKLNAHNSLIPSDICRSNSYNFPCEAGKEGNAESYYYYAALDCRGVNLVKIWGGWLRVKKNRFCQVNFRKTSIFQSIFKKIPIFQAKTWPFTATSGQIILFLFKSHQFRTYLVYTIS